MNPDQHFIERLFSFLPLVFIGMWVAVTFILSKFGWANLAAHYKTDQEFIGKRVGIISAWINWVSYKNALVLKYNDEGIYIKPFLIFRLFHPPLLIPWKDITEVQDKKVFFVGYKELMIGEPFVAKIKLYTSTFREIEHDWNKRPAKW